MEGIRMKDKHFDLGTGYVDSDSNTNQTAFPYKYDEGHYLDELRNYIHRTYDQHYSRNKYQATEFILDSGHGEGFLIGNIMKYAQRYGKKGSSEEWRKDILKIIHYAMIMLYQHDQDYLLKEDGDVIKDQIVNDGKTRELDDVYYPAPPTPTDSGWEKDRIASHKRKV